MKIHTIILAAGEGSRMISNKAKSLQHIGGQSMLTRIYETVSSITNETSFVVGYEKEAIIKETKKFVGEINICVQEKPIGTADAVKAALNNISQDSQTLILYGDVPLIKLQTLKKMLSANEDSLTILTTELTDPTGYGRVKKDDAGLVLSIVEEKDATSEEKKIKEIFTGVLCCKKTLLEEAISQVDNHNAAGEYYLTDIVSIISAKGYKINTCVASNDEVKGANTKRELSELESIYRKMKADELLDMGVAISDPARLDVRGTVIEAFSHLVSSKVGSNCSIGPYARLREGSYVDDEAKIGNFVETKKTKVGKSSKANHFAYLGDAEIGDESNIGAGTITCNYDGKNKHKTKIGDKSFVGTNSSLVAPITIGSNAYVAAGSVITKDVPDNALGVGRSKQKNKENWSKKKD